ncbi:hypothetical protein P170DRAFT_344876 [Aspergillus steynii IBT 23096]|uniref:Zn(2)-C6 fungal-type domain-containing protein n=1 Tax=Aspergillus steynii IBT 23096 TaxID=1392250 RepID=A0A2I2GR37_9EURO|nr:uncharacterized protein P170DRAFT_344876 [Aspergillus steynii IBT 23096]PLB55347.1 hypothetical protein P170DRAFT_344876 [Aspergillus steynii IBT 23096]
MAMKTSRYSASRQKACQQCSSAKARCDRQHGPCVRCTRRGLSCVYPRTARSESPLIGSNPVNNLRTDRVNTSTLATERERLAGSMHVPEGLDDLNFSGLELICPIDDTAISNRWLNPYIPVPGQAVKQYPTNVNAFIYRILKSYAAVAAHGRGILPFVHPIQMRPRPVGSPLASCLSLVRVCSSPLPGSEATAASVLQREMNDIFNQCEEFDDEDQLAAFQAYLIYAMVLFFRLSEAYNDVFRGTMMNLQNLARSSTRRGVVCAADQRRVRPRWEEWVITETKRRALYVMYLFDSILSTQEGLPTFLGTELEGLPAPANKLLWQAQSRYQWEREYHVHMAEWAEGGLTIDELWPVPTGFGETQLARRRARVDQWLENTDEFGTMLCAVTTCTHGD